MVRPYNHDGEIGGGKGTEQWWRSIKLVFKSNGLINEELEDCLL